MANTQKPDTDLKGNDSAKGLKRKKSGVIYPIIIVLLLCVMAFSAYQIISTLLRDKKAKDTYNDIINDFVSVLPDDSESTESPAETLPVDRPSESTEETRNKDAGSTDPNASDAPTGPIEQPEEVKEEPLQNLSVDFARLKSINADVCAWLQGQGGLVNYPVVQGRDNEYYLKHLIDGSGNGNGTLFVHTQNRFLQDDVTYIFGHHMQSGAMFGSLKKYDSSQYYWSHPEFRLYTPEKTYDLKIYAAFYGTGEERLTFNYSDEAAFNAAMAGYASRSIHSPQVDVKYGDKLVCLCTCAYQVTDGRYFILCRIMN